MSILGASGVTGESRIEPCVDRTAALPAWSQSGWFYAACVITAILGLWIIHRYRLRQAAEATSVRSDERLAERTRLARELYETFIQTIQGSKMVVDDALERPSDLESMHQALTRLAVWLDQAIEEGKTALDSLRESRPVARNK